MQKFSQNIIAIALAIVFALGLTLPTLALAATTPSLNTAATYGVLSSTFTRNIGVTTITGDAGYTTLSGGGTDTVTGTPYQPAPAQAGIDQGTALTALNTQACTFTFASGPINLSTDTTHGTAGVYTPGVYCTGGSSAASIGTAGIILNGSGTYIFKVNGAFTTVDNSKVTLTGGATSCDIFFAPTAATTLGANTTFIGTIIDDSGITVGHNTSWTGRALAFGGTVTTDTDTITSTCSVPAPSPATLNVVKAVVNTGGGTATASSFNLHVKLSGTDVAGSPAVGVVSSGRAYTLAAGTYVVSEDSNSSYLPVFSGSCDSSGNIPLISGDNKTCTITNTYIPAVMPQGSGALMATVAPLISILKVPSPLALPGGSGSVTYHYAVSNVGTVAMSNITVTDNKCSPVVFVSGDANSNNLLDTNETWNYTCTTVLSQTTTNAATATGQANGLTAIDIANATVVVGAPTGGSLVVPPLIHIIKQPNVFTVPYNGAVTYTYTVSNPGAVALSNVSVVDNKCSPAVYRSGDVNNNNLLDVSETWIYTCQTNLTSNTTNTATAEGSADGLNALDYALATVLVSTPSLPKTGFPPEEKSAPWNVILPAGVFGALVSFYLARTKKVV
jgi:uncharacterized repeat protein (TIGR01451 family)